MTEHRSLAIKDMPVQCRWCKEPWPCETEVLRRRVNSLEATIRYDPDNVEVLINGERVIMSTQPIQDIGSNQWVKISLADSTDKYAMGRTVEIALKHWAWMRMNSENN